MAKQGNPNILGDLAPVSDETSPQWRDKRDTFTGFDGEEFTVESFENAFSDNNGHRDSLPMSPTVRRS